MVGLEEMSAAEITYWNNYYITLYPQATFVSDSTYAYNCHSYAWYSSSDENPWWMNQIYPIPYSNQPGVGTYMSDGSYSRVYKAVDATRVFFEISDHSMLIYDAYSNSIYRATLISKWGKNPVMIHKVDYGPYDHTGYTMWN